MLTKTNADCAGYFTHVTAFSQTCSLKCIVVTHQWASSMTRGATSITPPPGAGDKAETVAV